MDNVIILSFVTLTIFSLMFAIGLNHSLGQLTFLWSRPLLLLRSLPAVIVLVPVVVGLSLWLGGPATAVTITIVGASLAIGHLLSGPPREQRSVLAIAGVARNVGLALYIANLSGYGEQFVPTLLSYMILGALLAVPYSVWSKRRMSLLQAA